MAQKISVFTLCLLGIAFLNQAALAQEEGGSVDKTENVQVSPVDSLSTMERGEQESVSEPVTTPFNIPSNELRKTKPQPVNKVNTGDKTTPEGQVKPKENKQEVSFNIIYYLIYKFKQVDN
ncbi:MULTISPECIES: hypothetical protein [Roseivirga]|jgi:hypothetical protein|uniref:Uncharacterized protein n=1 Tax=Roseivirga thermotolerans TaxID=1758176 RepID=A0ABQ3I2G2_9BACT|nr:MULTISPECIES: hypothetical protein [Roseivirga]MEC7754470.1 hypothetical protein [Bacteroidota bacterium]GHE57823.1 hypothetical protein GCM10011340_11130 [Roseivirga thermotolerans]|tara:strand:+ start:69236 stop:69598 length:363 start_codon:yes stop_codon:yes gene_type:complete